MSEICVTTSCDSYCDSYPRQPELVPVDFSFLENALQALAGSSQFITIEVDASLIDPIALLRLSSDEGFLYLPQQGPQFAGLGRVLSLEAQGANRFTELLAQAQALSGRFEVLSLTSKPSRPLFFGGLAFAPGGANDGAWAPFGDASFVLPRWLYRRFGERASLCLNLAAEELNEPARRLSWLAELKKMQAALAAAAPEPTMAGIRLRVFIPPAETMASRIETIGRGIAAGRVAKVVTALRLRVELQEQLDPLRAFRRLVAGAAGSAATPFFFRRGGSTFLGATPELLVASAGGTLHSEALAGSCRHDQNVAEFLASRKNAHEHQFVVDAIAAALTPICSRLDVGSLTLRHLRRLSHLLTPIAGHLARPHHLLEIAERLHPTPAVGGWPRSPALDFLSTVEPEPRGWYAGPVGYFDDRGEGELRVALRSGLLAGQEALIYAGAGIVAGSVASDELAEMISKASPMLDALGSVRRLPVVHASFTLPGQTTNRGPENTSGNRRAA